MTALSHDDIATRIAETLGDEPLDAALQEHLRGCAECAALARALRALATEAAAAEPPPARWRELDRRLKARLAAESPQAGTASAAAHRGPWRIVLPLAAAVAIVALALWALRGSAPGTPEGPRVAAQQEAPQPTETPGRPAGSEEALPEPPAAALPSGVGQATALVAAASEDSLEAGLQSLGIATDWDEPETIGTVEPVAEADLAANAPPAWDDVLGSLEEELARLDATRQADLARTLRDAT